MFDKELMKQLATIPAENRAEWFAERDKLHALAAEMNRLNADEMVMKYAIRLTHFRGTVCPAFQA